MVSKVSKDLWPWLGSNHGKSNYFSSEWTEGCKSMMSLNWAQSLVCISKWQEVVQLIRGQEAAGNQGTWSKVWGSINQIHLIASFRWRVEKYQVCEWKGEHRDYNYNWSPKFFSLQWNIYIISFVCTKQKGGAHNTDLFLNVMFTFNIWLINITVVIWNSEAAIYTIVIHFCNQ